MKTIKLFYSLLVLAFLFGCNSEGAFSEPDLQLVRIDIMASPIVTNGTSDLTIPVGVKQGFVAIGYFSDGTSKKLTDLNVSNWHSSDNSVAVFSETGFLLGTDIGLATVTASKDGVVSNALDVNVTPAIITSITLTPSSVAIAKGQEQQLVATAIYSDATSSNITDSVVWESSDLSVATITPAGILAGEDIGTSVLIASKDGMMSNSVNVDVTAAVITSITITPPLVTITKGQKQQLVATAIYSDKTSSDITNSVNWMPLKPAITTVTNNGLLTGQEVGNTIVIAIKDSVVSNSIHVDVTDATITSITITPPSITVPKGQPQQLTATAAYNDHTSSDITDTVSWIPLNPAIATVTPDGKLVGQAVGHTTITASQNGIISNTVNIEITAAIITDIVVSPASVTLAKGQDQQLVAMANYTDASSLDITNTATWSSVDPAITTVTNTGLLSGSNIGNTLVSASMDGVTSALIDVEVSPAIITDITILPASISMVKGKTQQLVATATYSDASSSDITSSSAWDALNTSVAVVDPSGLLSGVQAGQTKVRAFKQEVTSNEVNINICDDLAGSCLDVFDTGGGVFFTSSPSLPYLDSIGGSPYTDLFIQTSTDGPDGVMTLFTWQQANELCTTYNNKNLAGRSNWRLATLNELENLYTNNQPNMFVARGWPMGSMLWTATDNGSRYSLFNLNDGSSQDLPPMDYYVHYASCVSDF